MTNNEAKQTIIEALDFSFQKGIFGYYSAKNIVNATQHLKLDEKEQEGEVSNE